MNFAILSFIIGFILQFEALFLLLPWIVGMIYGEYHVALIYLATAVVSVSYTHIRAHET